MPMFRRAQTGRPGNARQRDRWTTSYADFVTILLILFVAMAAHGLETRLSAAKPEPAVPRPVLSPREQLVKAFDSLNNRNFHWRATPRGLLICVEQGILFPSGGDQLGERAKPVVAEIAGVLARIPNKIHLVGYSDSRPIHSRRFRDNWELSFARSQSLRLLLTEEFGIDSERISVASRADYDPVGAADTEEGRASNRRVEILVLDEPVSQ